MGPSILVGRASNESEKLLIAPGDPAGSYLLDKVLGTKAMNDDLMPLGDDPLSAEDLQLINDWIGSMPGAPLIPAAPPTPVAPPVDPGGEAKAREVFDEHCTACHAEGGSLEDSSEFPLEGDWSVLVGRRSNEIDKLLIAPGDPEGSYLKERRAKTGGEAAQ